MRFRVAPLRVCFGMFWPFRRPSKSLLLLCNIFYQSFPAVLRVSGLSVNFPETKKKEIESSPFFSLAFFWLPGFWILLSENVSLSLQVQGKAELCEVTEATSCPPPPQFSENTSGHGLVPVADAASHFPPLKPPANLWTFVNGSLHSSRRSGFNKTTFKIQTQSTNNRNCKLL